ncbi:hypothetical protein HPP92_001353 [Vanilla planifolia]|uniref:Kinesin-like protein n=1 Tax=Vanilla planifolia TaxID=51239 RepID=A0A835S369_VANPL|nr:hypothetical protein HPP92_001353 [Vanilla planifolia]
MESLQRRGGVLISPSQAPRISEKFGRENRFADGNVHFGSKLDKEKGVNIQVVLRCRPLNDEEVNLRMPAVVTCNELRREVLAIQNIANKQIDKTFVFDKVFGPNSNQVDLFDQCVSPIVDEVLEGFNCTIFAYGQTGTGKTYTMEGGKKTKLFRKNGEFPDDAGVIPRVVRQIFDELEAQCVDYVMKVTFLEIYNEEITDLLAQDELKSSDYKSKKPIALMEDGKGGVFVRGLEEEIVRSPAEIYMTLEKCSAKRRSAETLLNKQSSRSHSIFSITTHIKEFNSAGEEMIKIGKLNMVDLAGSENVSKSGSRESKGRGEINKSLFTLGRVINALVEHSGHVPYRDSKLTRLLRDSLGGKTKTCIIATISPCIHCLEETLSTLEYANRAKNIKNKPEHVVVNRSLVPCKQPYEIHFTTSAEVNAAREKNGIYRPKDLFLQEEAEKKAMAERLALTELELESKIKQLFRLQELHNSEQHLSAELTEKLDNAQITQQLYLLHKIVSNSMVQQENQLKEMEEEMQSFANAKAMATKELRSWVEKLNAFYSSGITSLDGLAGELDQSSRLTFGKLYSQVLTHFTSLEDCFKSVALDANKLLSELQNGLSNQEFNLNALARLQREGHLRTVEATRSISKVTTSFFQTFDLHVSNLSKILEEIQTTQYQQLGDLERKFEECAANEERQVLEKVADMLSSSNARKKKLVQTAVDTLRGSTADRTSYLQREMSIAQDLTASVKEQLELYKEETERHCLDDSTAEESERCCLEGLKRWNGMEVNQLLRANLSSAATTALEEVDDWNKTLHSSLDSELLFLLSCSN